MISTTVETLLTNPHRTEDLRNFLYSLNVTILCLLLFDSNSAIMNHTFNSEQRNPMIICLVMISHKTGHQVRYCSGHQRILQHGTEKISGWILVKCF